MEREKKKAGVLFVRNIIWAAVIFVLCALPAEDIPDPHIDIPHLDKVVHFGMFFILALLLCNELEYQTRFTLRKIYITTVCIAFLYGGLIEILQQHFFNRSGDILDLLADVTGAVIGCVVYPIVKGWWQKFRNKYYKRSK